jgi:hypothetical protein
MIVQSCGALVRSEPRVEGGVEVFAKPPDIDAWESVPAP